MLEIVNRQRKISLNTDSLSEFAELAAGLITAAANNSFTIAFISDRKMRQLNNNFRGKSATTDVLSFPLELEEFEVTVKASGKYLGDIVISAEQAQKQASENKLSLEMELKQLILHGILHLSGFDHETDNGEMNALELELRDKLLIS